MCLSFHYTFKPDHRTDIKTFFLAYKLESIVPKQASNKLQHFCMFLTWIARHTLAEPGLRALHAFLETSSPTKASPTKAIGRRLVQPRSHCQSLISRTIRYVNGIVSHSISRAYPNSVLRSSHTQKNGCFLLSCAQIVEIPINILAYWHNANARYKLSVIGSHKSRLLEKFSKPGVLLCWIFRFQP